MWVFDFEVFSKDWLVVIEHLTTSQSFEFINDQPGLLDFYEKHKEDLWIGFNNKRYDDYIMQVILQGENPKRANDIIIEENNILKLYKLYDMFKYPLYSIDVSQDGLFASLKELEGYMGLDIEESTVPFTLNRKLTLKEIYQVLKYCRHDVRATKTLAIKRADNIKLKMELVKTFGLTKLDLKKTNAQLTAKILNATDPKDFGDEFTPYVLPDNILVSNKEIIDFYCHSGDLDYSKKLKVDIAGIEHTLAYGGLHGARPNVEYEGEVWLIDGRSFYPTIMIEFGYMSRGIPENMKKKFVEIYELRQRLKVEGKKSEAEIYKLVLNTVYGIMKNKYNGVYDPKMSNNVCITGQLLLIDIIEKIEPYCELIQSNTDGIAIIPHNKKRIKEEIAKWEKRTNIVMDIEIAKAVYQKDVNNYIMVEEDDSIVLKGGMVYQSEFGSRPPIRRSNKIIADATVAYFTNKIEPEDFIANRNDPLDYQIITKTGSTFDSTIWKNGNETIEALKNNRVYASKNKNHGKLFKIKEETKLHAVPNIPEHCILANNNNVSIDEIDKRWYIDKIWDQINAFKGVAV